MGTLAHQKELTTCDTDTCNMDKRQHLLDFLEENKPTLSVLFVVVSVAVFIVSVLIESPVWSRFITIAICLVMVALMLHGWYHQKQAYNRLKEFLGANSPVEDPTEEDVGRLAELHLYLSHRRLVSVLNRAVQKEESYSVRASAALWVGAWRIAELTDTLIETMLGDQQWQVRAASARALGMLRTSRALAGLGQVVADREQQQSVRQEAAKAIGKTQDISALGLLQQALVTCHQDMDDLSQRFQNLMVQSGVHGVSTLGNGQSLRTARRVLAVLEEKAAAYTSLEIPTHLQIELEDQRQTVSRLEAYPNSASQSGCSGGSEALSPKNHEDRLLQEYSQMAEFLIRAIEDIDTYREQELWVRIFSQVPRFQERIKRRLWRTASE